MRAIVCCFLFLCLLIKAEDSVSIKQKGNEVTVTVRLDCKAINDSLVAQIRDIQEARKNSLARPELSVKQRDVEDQKYDNQIADAKRNALLKMFDESEKAIRAAKENAATSDEDQEKEAAEEKARIEARLKKKKASKPKVDTETPKVEKEK